MADSRNQNITQPTTSEVQRPTQASPLSLMNRMMRDMDRLFDDFGSGRAFWPRDMERTSSGANFTPKVDVFERDGKLTVHADLPGMKQEDVKVTLEESMLTIAGERTHQHEHEKDGVYRCEREYGSFNRRVALPEGVNPDSIQASFEQGVLEVTMPVPPQQASKARSIPIGKKATSPTNVTH
ncbi:MAG TPA: Hsp20/alpha crystallin family protein [Polyangiaceae bacterium]|nr:Hsp20/alpha crystallin family protein [Polyangiaceae bacterium]